MEACAGARYSKCESVDGRRSRKPGSRTDGGNKQRVKSVAFVLSAGKKRVREKTGAEKKSRQRSFSLYTKVKGNGGAKAGCCEPDINMSFAGRENSSSGP